MRSVKPWLIVLAVGAALAGTGLLVGCSSDAAVKGSFGSAAQSAIEHGGQIAAEGFAEGNPIKGLFGSLLQVLGAGVAAVGGVGVVASKVANKKIAAFDAAPETVAFKPDGSTEKIA